MEGNTLTIDSTEHNHFPEGMTVEVVRDHTNQFTDRRVLSVRWDQDRHNVPDRIGHAQLQRMPDEDRWTEIGIGLSRQHDSVTFEE